jgi:hypothetical protein
MTITIDTRTIAIQLSDVLNKAVGQIERVSYSLYLYGNPDAEW